MNILSIFFLNKLLFLLQAKLDVFFQRINGHNGHILFILKNQLSWPVDPTYHFSMSGEFDPFFIGPKILIFIHIHFYFSSMYIFIFQICERKESKSSSSFSLSLSLSFFFFFEEKWLLKLFKYVTIPSSVCSFLSHTC